MVSKRELIVELDAPLGRTGKDNERPRIFEPGLETTPARGCYATT